MSLFVETSFNYLYSAARSHKVSTQDQYENRREKFKLIVIVIEASKLLKCHSKTKRRTPEYFHERCVKSEELSKRIVRGILRSGSQMVKGGSIVSENL